MLKREPIEFAERLVMGRVCERGGVKIFGQGPLKDGAAIQ